jgi:PBP1b-binding outer membrane lipoprotein LpoB
MKKVIAIFAIATTLVACGGNGTSTEATTDSTAVAVDSTTVDTTAQAVDTTAVAPATEVK